MATPVACARRLAFTRRAVPGLWYPGQPRGGDGGAALLAPAEPPGCQPGQRRLDLGEREPLRDSPVKDRARPPRAARRASRPLPASAAASSAS